MPEYFPFFVRLIAALAGGAIAHNKGRDKFGWGALCFVFPPLVVAILFLKPKLAPGKTKRCPYCSRVLYKEDNVCRYCSREQPIELVQCRNCGNFVPEKEYCTQCNRKM